MNCKNCGAPIEKYARRCPYCETPYNTSEEEEKRKSFEESNKIAVRFMVPDMAFDGGFIERQGKSPQRFF